jgi:hypothetical protein
MFLPRCETFWPVGRYFSVYMGLVTTVVNKSGQEGRPGKDLSFYSTAWTTKTDVSSAPPSTESA